MSLGHITDKPHLVPGILATGLSRQAADNGFAGADAVGTVTVGEGVIGLRGSGGDDVRAYHRATDTSPDHG